MKRLSLFFSLCLMASYAVAYDFSADALYLQHINTLYYNINADGETVTLTYGPETYDFYGVEIPSTVENEGKTYTVTEIGYRAFFEAKAPVVIMPNTITNIQSEAFYKCTVSDITFSKGLKSIGDRAFYESNLVHIELFDGVETIGKSAFADNRAYSGDKLISIILPNSITSIGEYCFTHQGNLTSITLPENLKVIENGMFYYCRSLSSVVLPKNLIEIKDHAFDDCILNEIEFPSTLKKIGASAFEANLFKTILLPDNITEVGEDCFANNLELTSISFSKGMTTIPKNVCSGCEQLTQVIIPEGITTINYGAFSYCTRLSTVRFPEGITNLETGIFMESGISTFTFPSNWTAVPQSIFAECYNLTEITIPSTIETIGSSAFEDCTNLKTVNLSEGLIEIQASAFRNCEALESIVIPEGVKLIDKNAFYDCERLVNVQIPSTLEKIEESAFGNCYSLKKLTFPHTTSQYGRYVFSGMDEAEIHIQRAVLPQIISSNSTNPNAGCTNSTLYVPTGAKATYEASTYWNVFTNIVEEDVPDVYYNLNAQVKEGNGSITINGEMLDYQNNYSKQLLQNESAEVAFTPAEGYEIKQILCNGNDITNELSNTGTYNIESIEMNYVFEAYFKEKCVVLHLISSESGSIDILVEKHETFNCNFSANENWTINSIRFNGRDVTSEWDTENGYTTPALTDESTLSISFESNSNGVESTIEKSNVKAYAQSHGQLSIDGAAGETVSIYSTDGVLVLNAQVITDHQLFNLSPNEIYIVKTSSKTIKVAL